MELVFDELRDEYYLNEMLERKENPKGIYIWGFLNEEGVFCPAYVGKARKGIRTRVQEHFRDLFKVKETKYKVLEESYMSQFGIAKELPAYVNVSFYNLEKMRKKDTGDIEGYSSYANDPQWFAKNKEHFVSKVYSWGGASEKNLKEYRTAKINPIQSGFEPEKFRFVFAKTADAIKDYEANGAYGTANDILDIYEAYVKFSLKTKTLSHSLTIGQMRDRFGLIECSKPQIVDKTKDEIFRKKDIDFSTIQYYTSNLK